MLKNEVGFTVMEVVIGIGFVAALVLVVGMAYAMGHFIQKFW